MQVAGCENRAGTVPCANRHLSGNHAFAAKLAILHLNRAGACARPALVIHYEFPSLDRGASGIGV